MILHTLGRQLPRSLSELPIPIDEAKSLSICGLLREARIVMSCDEEALGVLDLVEVFHNDIRARQGAEDS
jgi:hypothetical protein